MSCLFPTIAASPYVLGVNPIGLSVSPASPFAGGGDVVSVLCTGDPSGGQLIVFDGPSLSVHNTYSSGWGAAPVTGAQVAIGANNLFGSTPGATEGAYMYRDPFVPANTYVQGYTYAGPQGPRVLANHFGTGLRSVAYTYYCPMFLGGFGLVGFLQFAGALSASPAVGPTALPTPPVFNMILEDMWAIDGERIAVSGYNGAPPNQRYVVILRVDSGSGALTMGSWVQIPGNSFTTQVFPHLPTNSTHLTVGGFAVVEYAPVLPGGAFTLYDYSFTPPSTSLTLPTPRTETGLGGCRGTVLSLPGFGCFNGSGDQDVFMLFTENSVNGYDFELPISQQVGPDNIFFGREPFFYDGPDTQGASWSRTGGYALAQDSDFKVLSLDFLKTAFPCCGVTTTPPTRQFPRDDTQGISTARVRIGRAQPTSRQHSYRQGFRGTYT